MSDSDLGQVVAIELKVSASPWNLTKFQDSMDHHASKVMVDGKTVIGFAVVSSILDEAELLNIAVAPGRQGQGLGTKLLSTVLEQLSTGIGSLYLEVRVSNFPAIRLYKNLGFEGVGQRRAYYPAEHGREDALVMRKDLISEA